MLDLNTLIPPGSGMQLTNAFNINDRGEILAKAAPLGFTPNDDEDLGHLVLLIPCEKGNEPGCEATNEAAASVAPHSSSHILNLAELAASPQRLLTHGENAATWRARMQRQFHIPAVSAPKN